LKNHVAGAVKDKLLKELEGRTGETDSEAEDSEAGDAEDDVVEHEDVVDGA
jgi:hypothetical protein